MRKVVVVLSLLSMLQSCSDQDLAGEKKSGGSGSEHGKSGAEPGKENTNKEPKINGPTGLPPVPIYDGAGSSGAPGIVGNNLSGFSPVAPVDNEESSEEINGWVDANVDHFSTFAADVDTGSYTHTRALLNAGTPPIQKDVRVEEFVNYFKYPYPEPEDGEEFSVTMDSAPSLFQEDAKILRIGIKGKERALDAPRKKINLVFLTDVSGSMMGAGRLDLAKSAMETLINSLNKDDQIAIVTYASSSKVVLPLTPMSERAAIIDGIYSLQAEGATAMSDGINLAYKEAEKGLSEDSLTRVVVLSDGDANIGNVSPEQILEEIKAQVNKGIYLTTVGFGMGNYRDDMMEKLANSGNGNYYYVDSITEAKRVFQAEVTGTLEVIAKDLKIQVDFDPKKVASYRLLGYENRDIADIDFRNDEIDAGELGPGHRITAFYEIKPVDSVQDGLLTMRLRYKNPQANDAVLEKEYAFLSEKNYASRESAPRDFRLGLAAAGFAEVLRESPYVGTAELSNIEQEFSSFVDENDAVEAELFGLMHKATTLLQK